MGNAPCRNIESQGYAWRNREASKFPGHDSAMGMKRPGHNARMQP